MEKEQIIRRENLSDEMKQIEEFFIKSACEHTDDHILSYVSNEASFEGRYINSDLFKETFPLYAESIDGRKKYNWVVHNSAAVLARELFFRVVKSEDIKKCILVGGIPGAGKSQMIHSLLSDNVDEDTMIYEGNIASPTIIDYIKTALSYGKKVSIIIVNPTLELSQRNLINRYREVGRCSRFKTVATIASGLPNRLEEIHKLFPNVPLVIFNKQNNSDVDCMVGWKYLSSLYKGTYEEIMLQVETLHDKIMEELSDSSDSFEIKEIMKKGIYFKKKK